MEANKLFRLIVGKCPKCCIKRFENHNAESITMGTKLKYSIKILGMATFFNKTNGKTRESQVTKAHPKIVNKVNSKEDIFYPHSQCTSKQSHK